MIGSLARAISSAFGRPRRVERRAYEGAGGGRRFVGMRDMPAQLSAMHAARGPLGRRARALVANNALAASGIEAWVSALVGPGIKPQSAHPDPRVREALNLAFEAWTDESDADGLQDFYGQQALAVRRMVVDGDVFGLFGHGPGIVPLQVRLLDAEQVDAARTGALDAARFTLQGVEFGAGGRRTAYHVFKERPGLPVSLTTETVRVPAEDVLHLFNPVAPGQVRGVSWLAPVLTALAELDAAQDAQLVRQKVAALLTGFIVEPDGAPTVVSDRQPVDGVLDASLEPGEMKVLQPGQDIRFSDPAKVGAEVIDFLKETTRRIAAGLGVPYEVMTGDLSDVNYSSIRAGLVEWRRRVEALQHQVIVHRFCRPVWQRFVTTAVLSGTIAAPGVGTNPAPYLAARWITPRFDWVDPLKDLRAEVEAIQAGLMSRRQAVSARGYDVEELDREIAADRARETSLGLAFVGDPRREPEEDA